ncbi:Uncharacterized protein QTN25_006646 [Entamoeba marina]
MRAISAECENFNFLMDSFKTGRMDSYEEAVEKGDLARWMKTKLTSFLEKYTDPLDKQGLAKLFRERTESNGFSVEHKLADQIVNALNALYESSNEKDSYFNALMAMKNWFEDHLDEPDGHLIGLGVDEEAFTIIQNYCKVHSIMEQLADNNIRWQQRGRIHMKGYEAWRILRKGAIVIWKENNTFCRVVKDVRVIDESTIVDVYVNREETSVTNVRVADIILMPSDAVNPGSYASSNCGSLVKDREKEMLKDVLVVIEKSMEKAIKKQFDIKRIERYTSTRHDLKRLTKMSTTFDEMPRDVFDKLVRSQAELLHSKVATKKEEFNMEKGYIYYPSWKRDRQGVKIDEIGWVKQKYNEWKSELQGCRNEVEKQPQTLTQQLALDNFNERREVAVKNAFIEYLGKFGFVADSFDDQVAMKCPKQVETIYSNKNILDTVLLNLYQDKSFEEFLQKQIDVISVMTSTFMKKIMSLLNELINSNSKTPTDYNVMIEQANQYIQQHQSDPQAKSVSRLLDTYQQVAPDEKLPPTPLLETTYGKVATKVFYSMQNEYSSVYHLWGHEAFYKYHKQAKYEDKADVNNCALNCSLLSQLRVNESRKF